MANTSDEHARPASNDYACVGGPFDGDAVDAADVPGSPSHHPDLDENNVTHCVLETESGRLTWYRIDHERRRLHHDGYLEKQ